MLRWEWEGIGVTRIAAEKELFVRWKSCSVNSNYDFDAYTTVRGNAYLFFSK